MITVMVCPRMVYFEHWKKEILFFRQQVREKEGFRSGRRHFYKYALSFSFFIDLLL